ncbi:TspO/MBR family protein [Neotamlana laminarinivorans]|uniref:Tryptophan-rich sensory protein n=1 Tax=Neotamlana laminarinivorans TaxID=2883124 RepID=A0A9X1L2Q7_9FLAO|nr:TspO/MBR family protein [Tamlana laminarinivorans]MCB4797442.1 tryptophan-rich sensory protein [Tamlana laminarinivorans]
MKKLILIFLIINFTALGIGSWLMNNGPQTDWYLNLNKAPWTPPGWVFGVAWTLIMICFSIYMSYLYKQIPTTTILGLFTFQFLLNVGWNFIFFNKHLMLIGLICIILLTFLIGFFLIKYYPVLKQKSLLILPYFVWLIIATSLNAYIVINN